MSKALLNTNNCFNGAAESTGLTIGKPAYDAFVAARDDLANETVDSGCLINSTISQCTDNKSGHDQEDWRTT